MSVRNLEFFFNPRNIAIIGSSEDRNSTGFFVFKNLIGQGFRGKVFPVFKGNIHLYYSSPDMEAAQKVEAHNSILDIGEDVDLAVVATQTEEITTVLEECGRKGVKGIVLMSLDFKNRADNPQAIEAQIKNLSQTYGFRVMGPDSLGFMRPGVRLNASLFPKMPPKGTIAFISQSTTLSTALLDRAVTKKVGISFFSSVGMKTDIDFSDLIDYLGVDPETRAIILYIESIKNGRKFMTSLRSFSCSKPIVVIKSGKFDVSAHVALTHSGFMAGEDKVYDAAIKRAGGIRVDEMLDLFYLAETLSKQRRPKGKRLAIITNSGGPAVIAMDTLIKLQGEPAEFSPETMEKLKRELPMLRRQQNPIDIYFDASPKDYEIAMQCCLQDKKVDGILVIHTPLFASRPRETAEAVVAVAKANPYKPVLTTWMGDEQVTQSRILLNEKGIPTFVTPEQAVRSFIYMYRYDYNLNLLLETPEAILKDFVPERARAEDIIRKASLDKRLFLNLNEVKEILSAYGIPVIPTVRAGDEEGAVLISSQTGFPVVLKIDSQKIFHKLEKGGVILNIRDESAVRDAYRKLKEIAVECGDPGAYVLIQPMIIRQGFELVIGAKKDLTFGSAIVFGTGGELLEAVEDYAVGLPPLNQTLAKHMMNETKIYRHLKELPSFREVLRYLEEILVRFSQLIIDFPQIKELDINPFFLTEKEGFVLDAGILLESDVLEGFTGYTGAICPPHLCICPYPVHFISDFLLRDGTLVSIKPIRPEDEPLVDELLKTSSDQTLQLRFQGAGGINHDWLMRYCQIDYDRELAFVATIVDGDREKIIGEVRVSRQADIENAELAIVVGDRWQGLGVGSKLCEHCIEVARESGVKRIWMEILKSNTRMLKRSEKLGFKPAHYDEDNVRVVLELT